MDNKKAPKLKINTFASFSVTYGDVIISNNSSRSQQVWKLFKYIIANHKKMIPTDTLIDVLWPDGDCVNPIKSLYSLIFRLRSLLASGNSDAEYILFQHNCYIWNRETECEIDIDMFETLCLSAAAAREKGELAQAAVLYKQAVELYKGDFLAESMYDEWVLPLSNYYKRRFITAVLELIQLYQARGDSDEIISLCSSAIEKEKYEESIHEYLIEALINKGQLNQAIEHYNFITNLLYKELGIQASKKLQALYKLIYDKQITNAQFDLVTVKNSMQEIKKNDGAFFCNLEFFKAIFQLDMRTVDRIGYPIYLGLVTVLSDEYTIPEDNVLSKAMEMLKNTTISTLRRGDVVAQYSKSQFVILLSALKFEDGEMVMSRISKTFMKENRIPRISVKTNISHLEYNS